MSLADATWQEFARGANVQESWVLWLYDSSGGVLRLGDRDSSLGGYTTHGMVTDWGTIRRSIDLAKFSAAVDNLTVRVVNAMYHGAKLIETIGPHTAGNKYINREVRIVSYLNGNAASEMRLYTGRLRNLTWTADEIELDIEQAQPWDYIRIPDVRDTTGLMFPVVYGSFTPNENTIDSPDYATSLALWPAHVVEFGETHVRALSHTESISANARVHVFEQTTSQFLPITDATADYDDTSFTRGDGHIIQGSASLHMGVKTKGIWRDSAENDFSTPANACDYPYGDDTFLTGALATIIGTPFSGVQAYYTFDMPILSAAWYNNKTITIYMFYDWATSNYDQTLDVTLYSGSTAITASDNFPATGSGFHTSTFTVGASVSVSALKLCANIVSGTADLYIYDIRISGTARLLADDQQTANNALKDIEKVYCGANGLSRSWTTGPVVDIHELHRDILHRYCGHTTTPTGWTALDSERSGWSVRYWQHEKTEVREILEQAQYEGAFIFVWDMTTGTGRYLLPQTSYSSSDVVATIVEARDTTGLEYSHTPFEDLVTKQVISYQRHPADSRYIATWTEENATARTAWNIQTLENVEQVELDMLVDDSAVQSWAAMRDNIFGDLKRIVSTTILNPRWFILEIGDIVQFGGDARYYMITDERRTMGRLTITAREVYA